MQFKPLVFLLLKFSLRFQKITNQYFNQPNYIHIYHCKVCIGLNIVSILDYEWQNNMTEDIVFIIKGNVK